MQARRHATRAGPHETAAWTGAGVPAHAPGQVRWAAVLVGGSLLLPAAVLVSAVTLLADLRGQPYTPAISLLHYALSGFAAVLGLLMVRVRRRMPLWLINTLPSVMAVLVCVPAMVDHSPRPLGLLLLAWPVTFAAAVLSARVAWCTLGVAAAAFAALASVSSGVDGLTLWVETIGSIAVLCWWVVGLQGRLLRLRETLAAMARTDPLTGLLNRRAFDEAIAAESERHRRGGPAMSLLMVDIDHFKKVNDSSGHHAGDEVLRGLGMLMSGGFRPTDVIGRVGGEEFAVLIPDCAGERAYERAVELCDTVRTRTRTWEHPITVSVGVSTAAAPETTSAELFAAADAALYAAKRAGRDRVGRA